MEQAARVVKLTEYGDQRMSRAIAQGLVSGDMQADYERLMREKDEALRDAQLYKVRNIELEAIRREDAKRHAEGYAARLRERGLRRAIKGLVAAGALVVVMIGVTVMSIILWGMG